MFLPYKPNKLSTFKNNIHPNRNSPYLPLALEIQEEIKPKYNSPLGAPVSEYRNKKKQKSGIPEASPPVNIFILIIEKEFENHDLYNFPCLCNACKADLVALSLKKLPSIFITDKNKLEETTKRVKDEHMSLIKEAISYSIEIVENNKSKNCIRNQ